MSMSETEMGLEIDYLKPRTGLGSVGVRSGTMLFNGLKDGTLISGKAYLFDPRCGPVSYQVTGQFSANRRRLLLSGMAPRTDRSCHIVREVPDSLIFDLTP
jgi:hypothetical protein